MNSLFSGKVSLLFHRNLLEATAAWGERTSKDFEKETGIPVRSSFINRSMKGMKLRFRASPEDESADFNKKMKSFLSSKKNYLKAYIATALKATLDNKSIQQELRALDPEKLDSATQWLGDAMTTKVK